MANIRALMSVMNSAEYRYLLWSVFMCLIGVRAGIKLRRFQTMVSFFTVMVPSELPLHFLLIQGLITLFYSSTIKNNFTHLLKWKKAEPSDEVQTKKQYLTLSSIVVNLATCYVFLKLFYDNISSGAVFRKAISDAGIKTTDRKWSLGRLITLAVPAFPLMARNIIKHTKTYGVVGKTWRPDAPLTKKLRLDVYWHQNRKLENAPVLMYIHGGGWVTGHRTYHSLPLLYQVARSGWIVVSVNYRLCPRVRVYPEQLTDLKKGLAWIKQNISKYGGNPDFIACAGESAGGHLATLLSLTPNDPTYQPGFEDCDTTIQACVNLYGVMDLTDSNQAYANREGGKRMESFIKKLVMKREREDEAYKRASPYWRVQQLDKVPPIMTIHGLIDTLVPYEDATHFHKVLDARRLELQAEEAVKQISDVFVSLPGAHHAFNFVISPRTLAMGDSVIDFLTHIYNKTNQTPGTNSKL